jgi:hypothetical protein
VITLPLTVRLRSSRRDSDITAQVHDLSFRTVIPGGYASLSISLSRPLRIQPDDIEYYGSVYVYDGRSGATIWEGRLEDPGRTASDAGEVWSITAIGPMAHASDQTLPLIYVDQQLDGWERSTYSSKSGLTESAEIDADTPALQIRAQEGATMTTSWQGDWIYRGLWYAQMKLGRVRCDHIEGAINTNIVSAFYTRLAGGSSPGALAQDTFDTTQDTMAINSATSGWVDGHNVVSIRAGRISSTITASDLIWANYYNIVVRSALKNADGSDVAAAQTVNNIDPVEVIADLLGRVLNRYDGAFAVLNGSGVDITQLSYPDGVTPAQVFEDLAVFDPAYYWAAWETNPYTGKYRFEYSPWPTTVRYEATTVDGFDSPGSATDLYNACHVRWKNPHGKIMNTQVTSTVQQLTDAGITRRAFIDMADEIGSLTGATQAGTNFLAEHQYPPNAGTLTVARKILDNVTGRMVSPWEILPGGLIRVTGVLPRVDSLNPTARDGVTIFKVLSVEFNASDATATLELDSYSRTVSHQLRKLKNTRLRRR